MEALWNFKNPKKCFGFWAVFILAPLLVNIFIWKSFVAPGTARLQVKEEMKKMTVLQPKLEGLLAESHELLSEWRKSIFTKEDPSAAMQTIHKLGAQNHVEIKEIRSKAQKLWENKADKNQISGYSQMSVDLEVRGNFARLMRWMNDVEREAGLEIDSWKLTPAEKPGDPHRLTVSMDVFLK